MEAKELYDKGVKFIDVREKEEHDEICIPNTELIPLSEMQNRWQEIPDAGDVVIYCRSGARSGNLINQLIGFDYSNLLNLEGGIIEWYQNNLPVEKHK